LQLARESAAFDAVAGCVNDGKVNHRRSIAGVGGALIALTASAMFKQG
jgi:hypothetical protein